MPLHRRPRCRAGHPDCESIIPPLREDETPARRNAMTVTVHGTFVIAAAAAPFILLTGGATQWSAATAAALTAAGRGTYAVYRRIGKN